MAKSLFDRIEKAELRRLIDSSLVEVLAMPPAIALAADILACLHDLDGYCALCGAELGQQPHLGDCPINRHWAVFELAARLHKKKRRRLFARNYVMAPLSPSVQMVEAGTKALESSRYGDPAEMVVMVVLTAALRVLAPAFSLEMELDQELKESLGIKVSSLDLPLAGV